MSETADDLRKLADDLHRVAHLHHGAYYIVADAITNCLDHVRAVARIHELQQILNKDNK